MGGAGKFALNRFETLTGPQEDPCVAAVVGLVLESCFEATSQIEAPHPGPLNSKARRIAADMYARIGSGPLISSHESRVVASSDVHCRVEGE